MECALIWVGCLRMQYASMIAKGSTGDPTVLPAHEVLEMATIRGARALGLDNETGSLRVMSSGELLTGKFALLGSVQSIV